MPVGMKVDLGPGPYVRLHIDFPVLRLMFAAFDSVRQIKLATHQLFGAR